MIQYADINGKTYPFKFGMREVYKLSTSQGLEFDDTLQAIHLDFSVFLELFRLANKKGARLHTEEEGDVKESELILSSEQIEDAMDDDPKLFDRLQEIFYESKAFQHLQEKVEKKMMTGTVKNGQMKADTPGTKSSP